MNRNALKNITVALTLSLACSGLWSQNTMRITYTDGTVQDVRVDRVSDITFTEVTDNPDSPASLLGTWMWGKLEAGYYEVITFNDDHTYIGDDCYFDYGFNTTTYGTYVNSGIQLNLRSNGYGYMRMFRWFVTSLTENALEVMTQTGPYVYYRLQTETFRLKAGGEPMDLGDDRQVVFADGVTAKVEDGKLYGIQSGTTYIQILDKTSNIIQAFLLVVE